MTRVSIPSGQSSPAARSSPGPSAPGTARWQCRTCGLVCEGEAYDSACPYCCDEALEPLPRQEPTPPSPQADATQLTRDA